MSFGETLKEIRTRHKDTFRGLGEKTGIIFTYIDKIEQGIRPINKDILEKLIRYYPLEKEKLLQAYIKEVFPESVLDNLNFLKKQSDFELIYEILFESLSKEEKKLQLKNMLDRLEIECFKKGTYEKNKAKLELIKNKIEKL